MYLIEIKTYYLFKIDEKEYVFKTTYNVFKWDGNLQWISKRWKLTMFLKEMETYNELQDMETYIVFKRHGD